MDIRDLNVGNRVYLKSFDFEGKGEVISLSAGIHVITDAYEEPMYFREEEVLAVLKNYE